MPTSQSLQYPEHQSLMREGPNLRPASQPGSGNHSRVVSDEAKKVQGADREIPLSLNFRTPAKVMLRINRAQAEFWDQQVPLSNNSGKICPCELGTCGLRGLVRCGMQVSSFSRSLMGQLLRLLKIEMAIQIFRDLGSRAPPPTSPCTQPACLSVFPSRFQPKQPARNCKA